MCSKAVHNEHPVEMINSQAGLFTPKDGNSLWYFHPSFFYRFECCRLGARALTAIITLPHRQNNHSHLNLHLRSVYSWKFTYSPKAEEWSHTDMQEWKAPRPKGFEQRVYVFSEHCWWFYRVTIRKYTYRFTEHNEKYLNRTWLRTGHGRCRLLRVKWQKWKSQQDLFELY